MDFESYIKPMSCLGLKELFEAMFSNSEIVKSFKLSKTKCGYFINFGLAPYFKDMLVKKFFVKSQYFCCFIWQEIEQSFTREPDGFAG